MLLLKLVLLVAALDKPAFHELKVGDIIPMSYDSPQVEGRKPHPHHPDKPVVRPSPQSPPVGGGASGGNAPAPYFPIHTPPAPPAYGDVYLFGGWLNAQRAARGLRPLAHDSGLSSDAAINCSHGFGHFFMGRARRQNAGMGSGSMVWPMWIQSPAHAAALFDPSITHYGIACIGNIWTFSAY